MKHKMLSLSVSVLLLLSIYLAIFMGNVGAMNDDQNLSGIVWTSSVDIFGNPIAPSVSTEFCIWVNHSGWYRFPDTDWAKTEQGIDGFWWYSYVLPNMYHDVRWANGDLYRVQVNGEPWGDWNGNTTSNGSLPGPNSPSGDPQPFPYNPSNPSNTYNVITYSAGGGFADEQQWDVRTLAQIDLAPTNVTAYGERPADYPFGIPVPPDTLIPIIFNITNFGSSASGSFWVTLWNCSSTGQNFGPTFIAEFINTSLSPFGDSGAKSPIYWLTPSTPGHHYVNITVDSRNDNVEFDEVNNRFILHFITGPDLIIINVLVDNAVPTDPIYVGRGMQVEIKANAQNIGNSSVGSDFIISLYNITGPGGPIIPGHQAFNFTLSDLGPTEISPQQTWYWTGPWSGDDLYVNITVDYGDSISEAEENNNHFTIHFNIPSRPVTTIKTKEPNLAFSTGWYVNSSTELYFEPWSPNPKPWYTHYRILWANNGSEAKFWTNYTDPIVGGNFTIIHGEGAYNIEYYTIDSVGAVEPTRNKDIVVDDSEPLTSVAFGNPKYREVDTDYWNITSSAIITLSAIDHPLGSNIFGINNASGINDPLKTESGIFYRIQRVSDGVYVQDWMEATITSVINDVHRAESFFLPDTWPDGYYNIEYNTTDNLGQAEIDMVTVYLDNEGPISSFISDSIDEKYPTRWEINESSLFTMNADDGLGSGVLNVWYRFDTMDWQRMLWSDYPGARNLTGVFPGLIFEDIPWNHTLWIRGEDNLGNNGSLAFYLIYIEGDITPPLPPILRLRVSVNDIILEWEHSPDEDIDHYLIFRSTTKTGFDFSDVWVDTSQDDDNGVTPLRSTWNDTGAVTGASEYYYTMRGVDQRGNIGYTSNIAGKSTMTFEKGYNTFALPLEPFEEIRGSQFLSEDVFTDDVDTIYRYDTGYKQWLGHPKLLPASLDDFVLEMGEGYMLFITENEVQYTFTGSTGTAIRYIGGVGEEMEFREGLTAQAQGNQVTLSWTSANGATDYTIYRASVRMGPESLTDYKIQPIAQDITALSWTDISASDDEYYYIVVANNYDEENSGTYALAVNKYELERGYRSFSFVSDPITETIATFAEENFPQEEDTIYYYDGQSSQWQGHPKLLPENINNGNAVTGKGYMILTNSETSIIALIGL